MSPLVWYWCQVTYGTTPSPWAGRSSSSSGNESTSLSLDLVEGEFIADVEAHCEVGITRLKFTTNLGKSIAVGPGESSQCMASFNK
jgi:hypothetical protein